MNQEIINYKNLTHYFQSEDSKPVSFNEFNRALGLMRKIKGVSIDLKKARENEK